jgi:prevent-host-death family protein
MKHVKIADLKDHLSEHLRTVEDGTEVVVTNRDRPIARIVPVVPAGSIVIRPASSPFAKIRDRRRRAAGWAVSSTTLLAEERRDR